MWIKSAQHSHSWCILVSRKQRPGLLLLSLLTASIVFAVPCSGQEAFLERGQYLRVRINDELTSERSGPGDRFAATLMAPLVVSRLLPTGKKIPLRRGMTYRARTEVNSRVELPVNDPGMLAVAWLKVPVGREFSLDKFGLDVRVVQIRPASPAIPTIDIYEGDLVESGELLPAKALLGGRVTAVQSASSSGAGWIEVEFDELRSREGRTISVKGKLTEVLPAGSPQLNEAGRFRSEDWKTKRWVFVGSDRTAAIVALADPQTNPTSGQAKVKKGTEAGLVLLNPVKH